jgi:NarL family two-component system response regulator LiaR
MEGSPLPKLRLLVADDEILVRQGLCGLLALESDFEVVGQAGTGAEAIEQARRLKPDVILMDIQMPVMNGVQATKTLVEEQLGVRILVLTTFSEDALVIQAVQAGAHGYLLKDSGAKQIAAAIRSIAQGYMTLDSDISDKLLQQQKPRDRAPLEKLTAREMQVLQLLSQGKTNAEIGSSLGITDKTVRDHVGNILLRLNLRDRTQAALWAQQNL